MDRRCMFCYNRATKKIGQLYACDEHITDAKSSFDALPIGARFKAASWDYELGCDVWIKVSRDGIPNPAYPNLACNAEREVKTGHGSFAPGDRDYTWVMATTKVEV